MSDKKSKKLELLQRRESVAKRYIRGDTMRQIAESLEISLTTVHRDIQAAREDWRKNANESISEHKARELAKLDNLEMYAWQCLAMSQGDVVVTTNRGRGKVASPPSHCPKCKAGMGGATTCSACGHSVPSTGTEVIKQEVRRKSAGDARFMKIIFECIRQRCAIIGLNNQLPVTVGDYMPVVGFEIVQPEPVIDHDEGGDVVSTEATS